MQRPNPSRERANLGRFPRKEVGHRRVDGGHEELAAHHPLPRQGHREHPPLPEQQINEPKFGFKVARTKQEGSGRGARGRGVMLFVKVERDVSQYASSQGKHKYTLRNIR